MKLINTTIDDKKFISKHKDGATSFARDRVFTFRLLLCFLMTNLQKDLQRDIAAFSEAIQPEGGSGSGGLLRMRTKPLSTRCVENFSGKSERAVFQDFYVKLFIMNLAAAVHPIHQALEKDSVKVRYGY